MKEKPALGDQEMEALRFVSEHAPVSVGDVAKTYGASRGLARTTILTVMERLRAKGYLGRKEIDGVYRYSPRQESKDLLQGLVADFVQKSLGGSVSPFVLFLAESGKLTEPQVEELKRIVRQLEAGEGKANGF
jgi:predicted transcriptional regulator